jgi:D-methionine transport system ATP-binding protein
MSVNRNQSDLYELLDILIAQFRCYSQIDTFSNVPLLIDHRDSQSRFDLNHSQSEKHPAITQLEVIGYVQQLIDLY